MNDLVNPRANLGKANPELYQAIAALDQQTAKAVKAAGIADGFAHLLRLRASQINQCEFCVRMHSKDALSSGESPDRLAVLPAWRESAYFTEEEQAALKLVEAVTLISHHQLPDAIYAEAASVLSVEKIAAVEWLAIVINSWNRIAISSRYPVKP